MINVKDNLLSKEKILEIYKICRWSKYQRVEIDGDNFPFTGLTCVLDLKHDIVKTITEAAELPLKNLSRAYINLFLPNEQGFVHTDNANKDCTTLLYYVNTEPTGADDLGETFFYLNNKVEGISPVPGRIITFDSRILHRASSLRNIDRFTIALKWVPDK